MWPRVCPFVRVRLAVMRLALSCARDWPLPCANDRPRRMTGHVTPTPAPPPTHTPQTQTFAEPSGACYPPITWWAGPCLMVFRRDCGA
ncbi:hypothetical protein GCM10017786_70220 [Amycolatopsis deserti]|uniref:Secreted protein n=1 Tax=Amycolatopsis deserti TaxID=185696 RepID=A0ABQ3JHT4_9PSEU|nr:hypothetical protein GCM10017786_70220 [Amycolatopsis deserti]